MKADTDTVGLDHNRILADTTAEATMTPTETIPGPPQGQKMLSQEYFPVPMLKCLFNITLTMTPHIRDHLCTEALQAYSRDHSRS